MTDRYNFRERRDLKPNVAKFVEEKKRKGGDAEEEEDGEWIQNDAPKKKMTIDSVSSSSSVNSSASASSVSPSASGSSENMVELEDSFIVKDSEGDVFLGSFAEKLAQVINQKGLSEKDEEWKLDTTLLSGVLVKGIVEKFPELEPSNLKKVVEDVLENSAQDLIDEYCSAIPRDETWKATVKDDVIKTLEPRLQDVRLFLDVEEPTMEKILEVDASLEDRAKMVQFFDIYKNTEPYTEEHFLQRKRLCKLIEEHKKTNFAEQEKILAEEKRIREVYVPPNDVLTMKKKIISLETTDVIKGQLLEMYTQLLETPDDSSMFSVLKEKLDWATSLPYQKKTLPTIVYGRDNNEEINKFLTQARNKLDENLYGMENIKDELISILNDRITNPKAISTLALKGRPGTGKTAIAAALAEAVGLPFERIALGGMSDSTTLKGADSHWLGSGPSILLHILKKMGISNGVVLLDEIDKLSSNDTHGSNMQNALLHITDYTQNHEFGDAYMKEFPHDLSNIWFIYAMNDDNLLSPILRDRLTILEVEPYTSSDFKEITKRHLLPKALDDVSISRDLVSITDEACSFILTLLAEQIKETGVRPIQRMIRTLASRINRLRTTTLSDGTTGVLKTKISLPGFKLPLVIDEHVVKKLIDPPKKAATLSYFL